MDSKYNLVNKHSNSININNRYFSVKRKIDYYENIGKGDNLSSNSSTRHLNGKLNNNHKKIKFNVQEEDYHETNSKGSSRSNSFANNLNGKLNNHKKIKFNIQNTKNNIHKQQNCNNLNQNGNRQNSNNVQSLLEQRKTLPVYACRTRLIYEVQNSDTLLIMGETGSGKTTQIPQFFHEAGLSANGFIAVTQPRRVAAITVAKRVAQEMLVKLGELVGYTVRFEDCTSEKTKIKFVTDGCLLREAISDRLLKNYSVIMLDEAHERTINTDILFGIVKQAQKQRKLKNLPTLKILITSATMDIDHFSNYFGVKGMYLEGRTHPVRIMHTVKPQSDYLHACLVTLFDIHRNAPPNHDILIFLTGQEEIDSMVLQIRAILKTNDLNAPTLRVFPLYSQLPQNKQLDCFLSLGPNSRKCILATNIAETSITIPGIRYVIDSGFVKRKVYDPLTGMENLKIVRISQAQSWQRCGRAGRDASGFCYRTYSTTELDSFEIMQKPEILRSKITSIVLQLFALGIDCKKFDFLDKPKPEAIEAAYKSLSLLGAIRHLNSNPELTVLGKKMSRFPLDPCFSKLLLSAEKFNCLEEMLTLVALLSGESIFISHTEKREKAALAHAKFESKTGDHITLLNVYNVSNKTEKYKMWCHDNFLNTRNLSYARNVRQQLEEICKRNEMKISSCGSNYDQVRKCLIAGLFNNLAEFNQRDNVYLTLSSRQTAKIHPSSVLSGKMPKPQLILFTELISTERNFMRFCTEIKPDWIEDVAIPNYSQLNRIQNSIYS